MQYPRLARFSGTAQFAVSKKAIYQRSKEDWEMIRRPLMRDISDIRGMEDVQDDGNYFFGLLYEMMWHILMGLTEYCPGETRCRQEFFQDAVHCDYEPTVYDDWLSNRTKNFNCSDAHPGELPFPKWPENIEKDRKEKEREMEKERIEKAIQLNKNKTMSTGRPGVKKTTGLQSADLKRAGKVGVKGSTNSKAKPPANSKLDSHSPGSSSSNGKSSSTQGYKEGKPRIKGQKLNDVEEDEESKKKAMKETDKKEKSRKEEEKTKDREDDESPQKKTQKDKDKIKALLNKAAQKDIDKEAIDHHEGEDADAKKKSNKSVKQTKIHPYDKERSREGDGESNGSYTSKKLSSSKGGTGGKGGKGGKEYNEKSTTSGTDSTSKRIQEGG